MDSTLNMPNEEQGSNFGDLNEKSEIMKFFERHVNDSDWAYRELLKEILLGDSNHQA